MEVPSQRKLIVESVKVEVLLKRDYVEVPQSHMKINVEVPQ